MSAKVYRFTAEWCQPCKALTMVLNNENIEIKNIIDVDKTPNAKELMEHYGVRNIPTIIIDYGTGDFDRLVGGSISKFHKELLREWLTRENNQTN